MVQAWAIQLLLLGFAVVDPVRPVFASCGSASTQQAQFHATAPRGTAVQLDHACGVHSASGGAATRDHHSDEVYNAQTDAFAEPHRDTRRMTPCGTNSDGNSDLSSVRV
jgi:hypothetical protein